MKDFIKGWASVCLGSVAGAALGAASFFAIEALMPQPADAHELQPMVWLVFHNPRNAGWRVLSVADEAQCKAAAQQLIEKSGKTYDTTRLYSCVQGVR